MSGLQVEKEQTDSGTGWMTRNLSSRRGSSFITIPWFSQGSEEEGEEEGESKANDPYAHLSKKEKKKLKKQVSPWVLDGYRQVGHDILFNTSTREHVNWTKWRALEATTSKTAGIRIVL